ncbi:hypothetical protein [Paludibacter sp. 221]|nr:hypothetical protein [Paludibacter sp. 221]
MQTKEGLRPYRTTASCRLSDSLPPTAGALQKETDESAQAIDLRQAKDK